MCIVKASLIPAIEFSPEELDQQLEAYEALTGMRPV